MNRWLAMATYGCEVDGTPTGLVDTRVRAFEFETDDEVEAFLRTEATHEYLNGDGGTVRWPLARICAIEALGGIRHGEEVIGFIGEPLDGSAAAASADVAHTPTGDLQPAVQVLGSSPAAPEEYFLPPEKLIAGNPRQTLWTEYVDPSGKFIVGTWASEPGKWRIRYEEHEECRMLVGVSIVTDAEGRSVTLRAGVRFVIPRGFVGTWEVVEATRKTFVIYEPAA